MSACHFLFVDKIFVMAARRKERKDNSPCRDMHMVFHVGS